MALSLAVLVAVFVAPAAHAQSAYTLIGSNTSTLAPNVREGGQIPVKVAGELVVDFTGAGPAGCEPRGVCGDRGTLTWEPPHTARLAWERVVVNGHSRVGGYLFFDTGSGEDSPHLAAQVTRTSPSGTQHVCTDGHRTDADLVRPGALGDVLTLGLGQRLDLATRCSGPRTEDVLSALPLKDIGIEVLRTGGAVIDMRGSRLFGGGGYAGSVVSSLALTLGKTHLSKRQTRVARRAKTVRTLALTWAVDELSGQTVASLAGTEIAGYCAPLDSCGSTGSLTRAFSTPRSARLGLSAFGSLKQHSRSDLRAAVGLSRSGDRSGVQVVGGGYWLGYAGAASERVSRDDGSFCADSLQPRGGGLSVDVSGGQATFSLRPSPFDSASDPVRTRCAGPTFADLAGGSHTLASATVPLSALAASRLTLRMRSARSFTTTAWTGGATTDVTLVLRRIRLREQIF